MSCPVYQHHTYGAGGAFKDAGTAFLDRAEELGHELELDIVSDGVWEAKGA